MKFSGNVNNESTNSSFILGDIPNSRGNFTDLQTSKDQKLLRGKVKANHIYYIIYDIYNIYNYILYILLYHIYYWYCGYFSVQPPIK